MPEVQLPLFPEIEPEPKGAKTPAVSKVQVVEAVSAPTRQKTRASKVRSKKRQKDAVKAHTTVQMSKVIGDLLTVEEVACHCTVSRATIWRWAKGTNGFPQPLRFAPGTTRWRLHDVMAWQASRVGIQKKGQI